MPQSLDFFSSDDKKSRLYIKLLFDFILSYDKKKSVSPEKALRDFFSLAEKICSSPIRREIFIYLMMNRAASALVLHHSLGIPLPSVYREMNRLVELGLVERIPPRREGKGRPFAVYVAFGFTADDVVETLERTRSIRTPAYSVVSRVKQLILEDHIHVRGCAEVRWREVLEVTRAHCRGFFHPDIAEIVARELIQEGVKVWR
jgi:predicted transcriptional regulator